MFSKLLFACRAVLAVLSVFTSSDALAERWQSRAPVPGSRAAHSIVWTGSEAIVWGGGVDGSFLNTGARYSPVADAWLVTSPHGAPTARWFHTAVWTGSEMIVWGGRANFFPGDHFNDGARYNPTTDTWTPISSYGAPTPRSQCSVVWTGEEMIVWGGETDGGAMLADGAAYNPVTDSWRAIGNSGLAPRMEPTAVWTGSEMIVFGGVDATEPGWLSYGDGARYNPFTDSWKPLPVGGAPGSRTGHTAVWTGERMIVWGGRELPSDARLNSGASYHPGSDTWSSLSPYGAPQARALHAAVWTGTEMIVWGGDAGILLNTGARHNPATGLWTPMTRNNAPRRRMFWRPDLGIWTGRGMLVCAGSDYPASLDSTALYTVFDLPCPPVIVEQPQSVTATEGQVVTLAVGARGCVEGEAPTASQSSLIPGAERFVFETGARSGRLLLDLEFYTVSDSVRVYYEGELIFETMSSGYGQFLISYGPGNATSVEIVINEEAGASPASVWEYTVRYRPPQVGFQWHKNGGAINGQTNEVIRFESVSLADAGDYTVLVLGNGGSVLSAVAALTVETVQPTNCLPPGLVAWWRGDGNARDVTGAHDGELLFGTTFSPGIAGQSFSFDLSRARVNIADSDAFKLTNSLSFEGWINVASLAPGIVFIRGDNRPGLDPYHMAIDIAGRLHWGINTAENNFTSLQSPGVVPLGEWIHVAAVLDGATGNMGLYMNGSLVSQTNTTLRPLRDLDPNWEPALGIGNAGGTFHHFPFHGSVDEWALYSRALSADEIASIYRSGSNGKCVTNEPPPIVVYDVSREFSGSMNPTGVWSYGYSATIGGAFHPLTFGKQFAAENGIPISGWQVSDVWGPSVNRVMGNGVAVSEGGAFTAPSGTVYVWPGNEGSPGVFGVIRFTVPVGGNGVYRIESAARSNFDGPVSGDSEFYVLKNGHELFGHFLAPNSATGWSNTLTLASGELIDFVVGKGADGLPDHSSLKVDARVLLVTNTPPVSKQVFDLSSDFSLAANPNGPWSYGHLTGNPTGSFQLLNTTLSFGAENGVPISVWFLDDAKPFVAKVLGPGTAVSYLFEAPEGTVYFGANPDVVSNDFAAIRFTVPTGAGGLYRLRTHVRALYDATRSADSDFHVLRNGVVLFNQLVPPNAGSSYSNVLMLAAGDRIDFAAGRGSGLPDTGLKIQAALELLARGEVGVERVALRSEGGVLVTGFAVVGTVCRVERSRNLRDWVTIGQAVEMGSGVFEFIDLQPPSGTACFYRMLKSSK